MTLFPVVQVVWMSLHEIKLTSINTMTFVGLENYREVFFELSRPPFGRSLLITLGFVGGSVFFHVFIALILAILLDTPWLRGRNMFRNLYLIPWIVAGILVGYTWSFLFEPRAGVLNYLLSLVGLPSRSWTADPKLALPSIIIANIWRGVPYSLILQTAGLQSINPELYEVATVDGVNWFQKIRHITMPLIKDFILLNLILDTGQTFQVFDIIFAMTGGGPLHRTETLSLAMYHQAFRFSNVGVGSTIAVFLLLISMIIAVAYMTLFRPHRRGR